jgi:DNA repair protein RecO (recombination protein O)
MRIYTAEVLVLGKTKLGETDLILSLLSSEDSQIRAVAKGARKPGAKLCGISEPFTVFEGKFHSGKSLDIVSEAKASEVYADIRNDYGRLMVGSLALELAAQASNDGDVISRLYAMTRTFLDVLSSASDEQLPSLVTAYLLKVLAMIGYSPEYELCARNARLTQLMRSTFAEVAKQQDELSSKKVLLDLQQTMNFTEKHFPAKLKSLSYYRKSL